jgi:uncharacterized phage infection (PIP) family protein YhgE
MHSVTGIRRGLSLALLFIGLVAVAAAVTSHAALQAQGPPGINELTAQVTQLTAQIVQLNSTASHLADKVSQLDDRTAQLNTKIAALDAKLTLVDSRTIDISQDMQLLKQLANSTHDRLTAVCRNVNYAWGAVEIVLGVSLVADPQNCWRNYYVPTYAATFSSRWTDPIP